MQDSWRERLLPLKRSAGTGGVRAGADSVRRVLARAGASLFTGPLAHNELGDKSTLAAVHLEASIAAAGRFATLYTGPWAGNEGVDSQESPKRDGCDRGICG